MVKIKFEIESEYDVGDVIIFEKEYQERNNMNKSKWERYSHKDYLKACYKAKYPGWKGEVYSLIMDYGIDKVRNAADKLRKSYGL